MYIEQQRKGMRSRPRKPREAEWRGTLGARDAEGKRGGQGRAHSGVGERAPSSADAAARLDAEDGDKDEDDEDVDCADPPGEVASVSDSRGSGAKGGQGAYPKAVDVKGGQSRSSIDVAKR